MPVSKTGSAPSAIGRFIFMDFCGAAKFYLSIALLTLLYYVTTGQSFVWIILKAALFIVWGFGVNKLCTSGLKALAWTMAIVPQGIFILLTLKSSPAQPRMPMTPSDASP